MVAGTVVGIKLGWDRCCGSATDRSVSRRTKRFSKGKRGLFPDQIKGKIARLLEHLDRGAPLDALERVGCQVHRLSGNRKGAYAIAVSGSHRIVFRFGEDRDGEVAFYDVEVVDYHKS